MAELTDEQLKELQSNFEEYRPKDEDDVCEDCGKRPENMRLWWESGGYEYPDDGSLRCDDCGYKNLHQWDDFALWVESQENDKLLCTITTPCKVKASDKEK